MKILFCDDHLSFIEGLSDFMSRYKDIEFIGLAQNISEVTTLIKDNKIDVAFIDINLGRENGFDLIKNQKIMASDTCAHAYGRT
jgi:DNA-binding NarL/FixJ family response regulator